MPRSMAWMLLVLALSGPLLTHAEAADDMARTWAGSTEEGDFTIEDGGVGDDPVVAADWPHGPSVEDSSHRVCEWARVAVTFEGAIRRIGTPVDEPVAWPRGDRQAWLQVFRD